MMQTGLAFEEYVDLRLRPAHPTQIHLPGNA